MTNKCPFCGSDETYQFTAINAYDPAPNKACICNGCGEPLIMDAFGFHKPSHEEYEQLLASGLSIARTGWLKLNQLRKDGGSPPVLTGYQRYHDICLKNMPPKGKQVAEDSFYSGAAWMFTKVKEALLAPEGDDEFAATMSILEAEVVAYMASFPARRKREEKEKLDNVEREHGVRPN